MNHRCNFDALQDLESTKKIMWFISWFKARLPTFAEILYFNSYSWVQGTSKHVWTGMTGTKKYSKNNWINLQQIVENFRMGAWKKETKLKALVSTSVDKLGDNEWRTFNWWILMFSLCLNNKYKKSIYLKTNKLKTVKNHIIVRIYPTLCKWFWLKKKNLDIHAKFAQSV